MNRFPAMVVRAQVLLATVGPLGASIARAEPSEVAAPVDPRAEMRRLAEQQDWATVYAIALRIEASGGSLDSADLHLAATAAAMVGDVTLYRERLRQLDARQKTPEITAELDRLAREYGEVALNANQPSYSIGLAFTGSFATPEASKAATFAVDAALQTGSFSGLLPIGTWYAGDTVFEVTAGERTEVYVDFAVLHEAPTCGPCCHGSSDCWEELGSYPEDHPRRNHSKDQPNKKGRKHE